MIKKSDLKTGKAPERWSGKDNETINMLLVLHSDDIYDDTGDNWYIPQWSVANSRYYNTHMDQYQGYIDLEDMPKPGIITFDHNL